mgnify:CR=1 FL=1
MTQPNEQMYCELIPDYAGGYFASLEGEYTFAQLLDKRFPDLKGLLCEVIGRNRNTEINDFANKIISLLKKGEGKWKYL